MRFWLIAAVLLLACTAQAAVFSDNFDDNGRSPFWGYIVGGQGPSVTVTGGQLQVAIPATSSLVGTGGAPLNTGFLASCTLLGDFDVQVDYELTSPPSVNGSLSILAWPEVITAPVSLGGTGRGFNPNAYNTFVPSAPFSSVPTSDASGTLRMVRAGATAQGYHGMGGTATTAIGAPIAFSTAPARISLHLSEGTPGETAQGSFDNFSVNSGTLFCPINLLCGDGVIQSGLSEQCDNGSNTPGSGCCACLTEPLPAAPDVAGGWQLNTICANALTVVQALTLAQTPGAGAVTVTPGSCGTFFGSDGQIHPITSCDLSPHAAEVCGTRFAYYPPSNDVHLSPFSSSLGTCSNLAEIRSQSLFNGTLTTDGANTAVRIAGSQDGFFVTMLNSGGVQPCFDTGGALCNFEMRRNTAPAGMNVSVQPLLGVTITFSQVSQDTQVVVVPETTPSADVPPNFQVVANAPGSLYLDITPIGGGYASGPGANTICLSYPDANNDGIVDGTNPPVNENDLKILHNVGGTFVDQTSSRDTVNNQICAAVGGFSQFVLGAGDAPTLPALCGPTPRTDCRGTTKSHGSSILIKNKTGNNQVTWTWRGAATTKADFDDPLNTTDYQLCVYDRSAGTPISAMGATAPAGGSWQDKSTGFTYSNKAATPDGLFQLQLKQGVDGQAKITLKGKGPLLHGPGLPLHKDPTVTAQLVNSAGTCWDADFSTATKNDTKQFRAKSD